MAVEITTLQVGPGHTSRFSVTQLMSHKGANSRVSSHASSLTPASKLKAGVTSKVSTSVNGSNSKKSTLSTMNMSLRIETSAERWLSKAAEYNAR